MATQLIIRIEAELKEQVARLARAEGKTASEVVRDLLAEYVRQRDMAAHIQYLWGRIREQMPPDAADPEYVATVIRQVRGRG